MNCKLGLTAWQGPGGSVPIQNMSAEEKWMIWQETVMGESLVNIAYIGHFSLRINQLRIPTWIIYSGLGLDNPFTHAGHDLNHWLLVGSSLMAHSKELTVNLVNLTFTASVYYDC